jgi:hypothetical protein
MFNVVGSIFGMKNKKEEIRSRMFIFADFAVTEEYELFMEELRENYGYKILEEKENFDVNGTLTKIITYTTIRD